MSAPGPLKGLDRGLATPRSALVRVLAWAVTNFLLLLVCTAVAAGAFALPPLSLLPARGGPLFLPDVVLLAVTFGSIGWVLHLGVVAAVSRLGRARLWMLLASPLLSAVVFGLPYVVAPFDTTNRAVVVAWTLYGLLCRPLPRARTGPGA